MFSRLLDSFSLYKGLPRAVWMLFICNFINGLGAFVHPFLTLYLTVRLGLFDGRAGLFIMLLATCYVPGALIGGRIADKFDRKKTVFLSQLGITAVLIACGILEGRQVMLWILLLMEVFDGICDPARDAIAQDITTLENRQASFSLMYLAGNLGFIVGPLIAGVLFFKAIRWIFWGTGIASSISLIILMVFIPESKPDNARIERSMESNDSDKAEKGGLWKALSTRKSLLMFALGIMFFSTAYSQVLFGLPLTLVRRFKEMGSTLYGTVNSLNGLICTISTAPLVALLHHGNPLKNVMLSGMFFVIGFSFIGLLNAPWMFFIVAIAFTLGEVIQTTNSRPYIANNTPITHRARFQSVLPVIMFSGSAFGPMIAGFVSQNLGLNYIWPFSSVLIIIGSMIVWGVYVHDSRQNKTNPNT
ncbi:MAG: MFS transporter [Sphaerochaetaceae bacterium]|nr:MFS transporter [Sphaerochaetaceae bacterium]